MGKIQCLKQHTFPTEMFGPELDWGVLYLSDWLHCEGQLKKPACLPQGLAPAHWTLLSSCLAWT